MEMEDRVFYKLV